MAKEKVKKPIFKRWWFWVLVVIIVISIGANMGGNDESSKGTSQKTSADNAKKDTPKKETSKKESKPAKKEKKSYGIGDKIKVGDMEYTILSKKTATQVGPSALPDKANGKFIVIELSLKNNGNEKVTVDSSFFKLKRGSKTYEAAADASMSANQGEDGNIDNSFFMQDLNPDSEMKGKVVFDVAPEVANAKDLVLQVQTGSWGTQTGNVNLK
ncbi:DUF4352 domain-containing protein [Sporolactobacillus kofuensis]|uniref:DUF4352 domain-containing protein n=1 Tax=Sporolactobacillus kofuensis TaxID=269672 RepID=A0ABW1WAS9_9BACL|nr:DUF4352 domain-containing protein [Sporolactobacillus kofuensis]MCO7177055.1 DUF4352 domain-containing protein [Sporolactobacillus kofuensis]